MPLARAFLKEPSLPLAYANARTRAIGTRAARDFPGCRMRALAVVDAFDDPDHRRSLVARYQSSHRPLAKTRRDG